MKVRACEMTNDSNVYVLKTFKLTVFPFLIVLTFLRKIFRKTMVRNVSCQSSSCKLQREKII